MYGKGEMVFTKIYGYVFTERGNQKIQFFEYVINDRPVIKKRLKNKLAKLMKNFVFKLIF